VILSNRHNQQRLFLYQPALKELAYRNSTDRKTYLNVGKFAKKIKICEAKELSNLEKKDTNNRDKQAEKQFFVDIWQGIETISKLRGQQIEDSALKSASLSKDSISLSLDLSQNLSLLLDGSIDQIAPMLCQSLESKFLADMALESPLMSP
jgi:hypothetical protein